MLTEQQKLTLFVALHRPLGKVQKAYHFALIVGSFATGFLLNMFNLNHNSGAFNQHQTITAILDSILLVILSSETIVQLWTASSRQCYKGISGQFRYLLQHFAFKSIDLVGIITYLVFLIKWKNSLNEPFNGALSIGHLTQILQIYRLSKRQLRLIVRTFKFTHTISIFTITVTLFLLMIRCLHYIEIKENNQLNNIYDTVWLVFATISTIGYGDKTPVTAAGKLFVIVFAFFAVVLFSVMVAFFGAQLAQSKKRVNIISLNPAANYIQACWILNSMLEETYWKYRTELNSMDRNVMLCLQKIKFLVMLKQFKITQCEMSIDENILLYEQMLNRLDFVEKNLSHNSYTLRAINQQIATLLAEFDRS